MNARLLTFYLILLASVPAWGGDTFRSGETQTHLIELFSSEGCSSCPPADAWLAQLRSRTDLWKSFVPVEFHVDYWNHLGWSDPLSRELFTLRQQAYSAEWMRPAVYTPGFVLDGSEWRPQGVSAPWEGLPAKKAGTLLVRRTGKYTFEVSFDSAARAGALQVTGALLGNGLESHVKAGENLGKTLRHEFAVLSLAQRSLDGKDWRHKARIDLTPAATREVPGSYSAAFWVTKEGSLAPLQAAGGDLTVSGF